MYLKQGTIFIIKYKKKIEEIVEKPLPVPQILINC